MKSKEINKLSKDQLLSNLEKLKRDLFNMRFKKTNGPLDDTSKTSKVKKDIAKMFTKLNNKN
jgi:large subunit ribosomal protein L29